MWDIFPHINNNNVGKYPTLDKGVIMTMFKTVTIAVFTAISILAMNSTASAQTVHHVHHINYDRDYTAIVVYRSPNPSIHRAVQRKVIAAQRREARLKRRLIRASLRS
jgi:hypothetical protein